jgi:hypothetical protein
MASKPKFSDRQTFNWGYQDASLDIRMGWASRVGLTERQIINGTERNPLPKDMEAYCRGYCGAWAMHDRGEVLSDWSTDAANEFLGPIDADGNLIRTAVA